MTRSPETRASRGFLETLEALKSEKRSKDDERLNAALLDLQRLLRRFAGEAHRDLRELNSDYLLSQGDVDDALQELWIKVYAKAEQFQGTTEGEAFSWIYKIFKRQMLDAAKKHLRRQQKWRSLFRLISKDQKVFLELERGEDR